MAKKARRGTSGNFVSEWFGHRIHPNVVSNAQAVADQTNERCPFLSGAPGRTGFASKILSQKVFVLSAASATDRGKIGLSAHTEL